MLNINYTTTAGDFFFCYGDEENGHCACTSGHLTTANQSEIRKAYLVSVLHGGPNVFYLRISCPNERRSIYEERKGTYANCIDLLECLTGNRIESVSTVVSQKAVRITSDSKGIRYDIYVE